MKAKARKYPPYPGSSMDYTVRESARMALQKPNKVICIYCHGQALTEVSLVDFHQPDCPAKLPGDTGAVVAARLDQPRPDLIVSSAQRRRGEELANGCLKEGNFMRLAGRLTNLALLTVGKDMTANEWDDEVGVPLAEAFAAVMAIVNHLQTSDPLTKPRLPV